MSVSGRQYPLLKRKCAASGRREAARERARLIPDVCGLDLVLLAKYSGAGMGQTASTGSTRISMTLPRTALSRGLALPSQLVTCIVWRYASASGEPASAIEPVSFLFLVA